jgi:hypothetical protein
MANNALNLLKLIIGKALYFMNNPVSPADFLEQIPMRDGKNVSAVLVY